METEIWLPVVGYENEYEVSNLGRVRTVGHYVNSKNGSKRFVKGRIRKLYYAEYVQVQLHRKDIPKSVQRLVAEAFIPNPYNLPCVNHKDENKWNNMVENLEWCTYRDNIIYGEGHKNRIMHQMNRTDLSKQVLCVETGEIYPSSKEAWRKTGIHHTSIQKCCNGKRKTAGKYHWSWDTQK